MVGSAFGARFDMEVDALLILVLSAGVWWFDKAGAWVWLSGLLRYAFIAAGWGLPQVAASPAGAALALGASMIASRAAESWQAGLSDHITVQVLPPDSGDVQAGLDAAPSPRRERPPWSTRTR